MRIFDTTFPKLEALPEFPALVEEYYGEAAHPNLPPPKYDSERYRQLCKLGMMHSFGASIDGRLIGFMMIVVAVLPKYSVPVATLDTIFVGKAHRMSGAGVRLLKQAEEVASDLAGGRLLASSPSDSGLVQTLERVGYVASNRIFFKQVSAGNWLIESPRAESRELQTVEGIPAMSETALAKVRSLADVAIKEPQFPIKMHHQLHGGSYLRTVFIPAGVRVTAVLIKIPTSVILSGDAYVFLGHDWVRYTGYCVLAASAGRRQVVRAITDTFITMIFPSNAETRAQAEREFTDEYDRLASNRDDLNTVVITGE